MNRLILTFIIFLTGGISQHLSSQYQLIESIQVTKEPINDDSSMLDEIVEDSVWLAGKDVYYQCLISKSSSDAFGSMELIVTFQSDTVFINNYTSSSQEDEDLIKDYGQSAIIQVDTLLYNSNYLFTIKVNDSEGQVSQEVTYSEYE